MLGGQRYAIRDRLVEDVDICHLNDRVARIEDWFGGLRTYCRRRVNKGI